jgi:hypothetical protein
MVHQNNVPVIKNAILAKIMSVLHIGAAGYDGRIALSPGAVNKKDVFGHRIKLVLHNADLSRSHGFDYRQCRQFSRTPQKLNLGRALDDTK